MLWIAWIILIFGIRSSLQHARLMEPPSRASMWRLGFPTPKDIDDNQSYCGGYGVQWGSNGGKCGICGDPWNETPRAHEAPGGLYATGIIGNVHTLSPNFFRGGIGPKWKFGRTQMKNWSENFSRASGAQKKGFPNFSPAAGFFRRGGTENR